MARSNKILQTLDEADRSAFEEFLRAHPGATIDEGVEWLGEHGYTMSRKAVWTYKKNFNETLAGIRASAEMARAFTAVAREGNGVADLSEAALGRFNQLMMEKLFQLETEGELDSGELMKLSIALKGAVATKAQIEEIKRDVEAAKKAAVAAAEGAASAKGASGADVVAALKKAMGITVGEAGSKKQEGGKA